MADVYTRGGDDGITSLADGTRVPKDDPRIELLGEIDEANCAIGLARVNVIDSSLDRVLEFLQNRLFNCSACLAGARPTDGMPNVGPEDTKALEAAIDRFTARSSSARGFVLPGCDETSARLHIARAITRRAERAAVRASAASEVDPNILAFLNRASDLLYAASRFVGVNGECEWRPDAPRP
jgi:cob(I)alamin adenosyltransferase